MSTRTAATIDPRFTDARVCHCNALIEEINSGDGYTYWAHVKRIRIHYDHAAVPSIEEGK